MKSSAKTQVQFLVQQAVVLGLKYVVCSPGSRNAPLVIAFNQHPEIECIVIPDERSAAFYAIGMAQQTSHLVAVCCTSGSAALNYYPAIAEAYYQQIPLLVFTADRPAAWVDQGDGQTIVQDKVFNNHIRFSTSIPEHKWEKEHIWYVKRQISEAFYRANGILKGPVHINLPFSEPLYQQVDIENAIENKPILVFESNNELTSNQLAILQKSWNTFSKKMILCGQMLPNEDLKNVLKFLAEDTSVVVLVENTSNLIDTNFIHCVDRTLAGIKESDLADFAPDLLIVVGGAIVSKKIKAYLRKYVPKEIWKIGADFPFMDTYQNLTFSINVHPTSFLKQLIKIENNSVSNYRNKWKQVDYVNKDKALAFVQESDVFSDLVAHHIILDFIPENSILHLANSSVVRYAQLFDPVKTITTFCNRGTSGIDGSTSTAGGAAYIQKDTCTILITGDISFFYDSNAFFNRLQLGNLRIFLINNDGGGIFKIIPGPDSTEELNDFFVFNHGYSAEYICKAFEITYYKASSVLELENQMEDFYTFSTNNKPKLMEVFTDSTLNHIVLKHYFTALS